MMVMAATTMMPSTTAADENRGATVSAVIGARIVVNPVTGDKVPVAMAIHPMIRNPIPSWGVIPWPGSIISGAAYANAHADMDASTCLSRKR